MESHASRPEGSPPELAEDLLKQAEQIGEFLGIPARKVYALANSKVIPAFKVGAEIWARKSTLRRWVEEQEAAAQRGS